MEYYNDYGSPIFLISLVRFAFAIKSEPYLLKNDLLNVVQSLLIDCISMQIHVIENIIKSFLYETRKNMLVVNRTRINFGFVLAFSANLRRRLFQLSISYKALYFRYFIYFLRITRALYNFVFSNFL